MHNVDRASGVRPGLLVSIALLIMVVSITLLSINLYGLTQNLRTPGLADAEEGDLRFTLEEGLFSYQESINRINSLNVDEGFDALAEEASNIVKHSLAHLDWEAVDPVKYRQLIPIWENYFLHVLGLFSGMPQIERYHYADYKRSLKRGIGICGDASIILSSILDRYGINNEIVSFDGHVLVQYFDEQGIAKLIDPDFGVTLGVPLEGLRGSLDSVYLEYLNEGYSESEIDYLFAIYEKEYTIFDNTYHFMSKRYIFELVSYYLKWVLPIAGIIVGIMMFYRLTEIHNKV